MFFLSFRWSTGFCKKKPFNIEKTEVNLGLRTQFYFNPENFPRVAASIIITRLFYDPNYKMSMTLEFLLKPSNSLLNFKPYGIVISVYKVHWKVKNRFVLEIQK